MAPLVLQLLCTCKCLGPKSDGAGKVGCERLKGWKGYIIYLEPVCPLFWWLNPSKQGLFQSKQGSFGFQVCIDESNVDGLQFGISPCLPPPNSGESPLSQIGGDLSKFPIFSRDSYGAAPVSSWLRFNSPKIGFSRPNLLETKKM